MEVDFLSADRKGQLQYERLEELVRPNTKLLVCTHASNLTGNLLDVERAASFARRHNLYFLLDLSLIHIWTSPANFVPTTA